VTAPDGPAVTTEAAFLDARPFGLVTGVDGSTGAPTARVGASATCANGAGATGMAKAGGAETAAAALR
jgi:hypothetical protein